ncbi:hypothetical protein [Paenisporosarcina indica]|nr:hypothetical protein [Paenisporosarcina indica]
MKSLLNKVFGVKTVRPLGLMTCEAEYCGTLYGGTMYEYINGKLYKRGCC